MAEHAYTPDRRSPHVGPIEADRRPPPGVGEAPTPSTTAEHHPGGGETPSPLSRRLFFSLAATLPIAVTTAHASGFTHVLSATYPAQRTPDWQTAQAEAMTLQAELRQARAALEQRIGPRGLALGSVTLPSGRTVPIQAASPDQAKKLWRRLNLGREHEPERAAVMVRVREACERWDLEAERAGLGDLECRAIGARDRAKALTARAART